MIVKICGITSIDIAKVAEEAGATMIGFVFAESARRIEPEQARHIVDALSTRIKTVGVFVNEKHQKMEQVADYVGLDYIQLHGDEPPALAKRLSRPIIKAFSINNVNNEILRDYPADFFLIDSPGTTYRGGSGKTFDWSRLDNIPIQRHRLLLAGGLKPENVQKALQATAVGGVDVSSGVETKGRKDPAKIRAFLSAVTKASR